MHLFMGQVMCPFPYGLTVPAPSLRRHCTRGQGVGHPTGSWGRDRVFILGFELLK